MWIVALGLLGCGGLSADGVRARDGLAEALREREPARVAAAAREAGAYQGRDPALDRLLGDALANVLMRPDEGLALLLANPAPQDATWVAAWLAAAIRADDPAQVSAARAAAGLDPLPLTDDPMREVLAEASAWLMRHPERGADRLDQLAEACLLMDSRPRVGRQRLDMPMPPAILDGARALGAVTVAMSRPEDRSDRDPLVSDVDPRCRDVRLIEGDALPDPLPPRTMVISATDGYTRVHLDVMLRGEEPWVQSASDAQAGARWLRAAELLASGGEAAVRRELGTGLAGTAFARSGPTDAP